MQKLLIVAGLVLLGAGLAWPWLRRLRLGRLPGDIVIEGDRFSLYVPITTMILISVLASLVFWLFRGR